MGIFGAFGKFSGLTINYDKSTPLPIDPLSRQIDQVKVVSQIRYLGINITRDLGQYIAGNLVPLMTKLRPSVESGTGYHFQWLASVPWLKWFGCCKFCIFCTTPQNGFQDLG